jgi:hypothetical protein
MRRAALSLWDKRSTKWIVFNNPTSGKASESPTISAAELHSNPARLVPPQNTLPTVAELGLDILSPTRQAPGVTPGVLMGPIADTTPSAVSADEDKERLQAKLHQIRQRKALIQDLHKLKEEEERLVREEDAIMSQLAGENE